MYFSQHAIPHCVCQYRHKPILWLRGLCKTYYASLIGSTILDIRYTPRNIQEKRIYGPLTNLVFVGHVTTRIEYVPTTSLWTMTDADTDTTAVSTAPHISFALGTHAWNFTNEQFCYKNQPNYTRHLKLTGCDQEGEFTCDDGQCVRMEQRCNQVINCRDESNETGCKLMKLRQYAGCYGPNHYDPQGQGAAHACEWVNVGGEVR